VAFSPSNTVDIVIPNAGIAGPPVGHWLANTPLNSVTRDPLPPPSRVVDVNYLAVWSTVHAALFYFKNFPGPAEENGGHAKLIVFVASMGGYQPMPTVVDYNSSKWGVRGIFWSLRNTERLLGEGKPKFRVNLIAPTWVRTNMTSRLQEVLTADSKIKIAEVSDCVHVVLRMAADENVKGK
jgi:5'-hydroxyaverantin dehydrogenase